MGFIDDWRYGEPVDTGDWEDARGEMLPYIHFTLGGWDAAQIKVGFYIGGLLRKRHDFGVIEGDDIAEEADRYLDHVVAEHSTEEYDQIDLRYDRIDRPDFTYERRHKDGTDTFVVTGNDHHETLADFPLPVTYKAVIQEK